MNVLFICSKNQWRSRTAEELFKKDPDFKVKSAGTSRTARIRVNKNLIAWADKILVMEDEHKKRIIELFEAQLDTIEIIVLGIPDEYPFMDEELIKELKDNVNYYLRK